MPLMRYARQLGSPAAMSYVLEPQSSRMNTHHLTQNFRAGTYVTICAICVNKRCDG